MKALSLKQPWAALVAIGVKKIETQSWGTSYRGSLAIHACVLLAIAAGTVRVSRSLSIEEIAAHAGFSDQSHLTRTFKRHFEITPLSYRMSGRG